MSYHTLSNNYMSSNYVKLNNPCLVVTDNYRFDCTKGAINGNILQVPDRRFDYESYSKGISPYDQSELTKQARGVDLQWANKSTGRSIKASTITEQRKNFIQNNLTMQQNLIKTVKHTTSTYKKPQPNSYNNQQQPSFSSSNKFQSKTKRQQLINYHQFNTPQCYQSNPIIKKQPKNTIMSILEIRQLQQRQLDNKMIVHKITPSSSRQKLKTSSSKDSKGEMGNNLEKRTGNVGVNGSYVERYNKYINDGLAMGVNFDLKKQMMSNTQTPTNPNVKKFGQLSSQNRFKELYTGHQRVMSDLQQFSTYGNQRNIHDVNNNKSKQVIAEKIIEKDESLNYRQSTPHQDQNILKQKFKCRSKSNLSKYTQMKSIIQKQALSNLNLYQNQTIQKPTELLKFQIPQRLQVEARNDIQPNEKIDKKIHVLSYSSAKNKSNEKPTISNLSIKGSQTERKITQKNQKNDHLEHLGLMVEEKLNRKSIKLTLQRRN